MQIEDFIGDFLSDFKKGIKSNNRRIVKRKERNYIQDLLDLGFNQNLNTAWNIIKTISVSDMTKWPELDEDGSRTVVWFFEKKMPNGVYAYIKVKIDERGSVCLSFHPVEFGKNAKK